MSTVLHSTVDGLTSWPDGTTAVVDGLEHQRPRSHLLSLAIFRFILVNF